MDIVTIPSAHSRGKQANLPAPQIGLVTIVTSKEFIPAISRQSYCDMLTSQAAHMIRWHDRRIAKRFFQRMRQQVHRFLDLRLDDQFVVLGAEPSCDYAGIFGFVEVFAGEANRKGFDWARAGASHERDHG